jgi:thioredoxin-related protein
MAINVLFSKKKEMLLRKVVSKKVRRLSRELWWTGSPVAVFEKENQWETTEIPGWFSPWDFIIILKNFLSFWRGCALQKYKMFFKTTLHKILLFLQIS